MASAFVVRLVSDFEAVTGSVCRLQSPLLFEKRYWLQNGAHDLSSRNMFHVRVEQADHSVYLLKPPSHLWPYPGLERGVLASAFVVRLVSDFEAVTGSVCRLQSPLLFEKRYWLQNGAHDIYVPFMCCFARFVC